MKFHGIPSCLTAKTAPDKLVYAYAHCEDRMGRGKCSITVCDPVFQKQGGYSLSEIKTFVNSRDGALGTEIDNFILLESTIFHEVFQMHLPSYNNFSC